MHPDSDNGGEEPEWVKNERTQFENYRDKNKDGKMDRDEIKNWIVPPDYDHSGAESNHLMHEADANKVCIYVSLVVVLIIMNSCLKVTSLGACDLSVISIFIDMNRNYMLPELLIQLLLSYLLILQMLSYYTACLKSIVYYVSMTPSVNMEIGECC